MFICLAYHSGIEHLNIQYHLIAYHLEAKLYDPVSSQRCFEQLCLTMDLSTDRYQTDQDHVNDSRVSTAIFVL